MVMAKSKTSNTHGRAAKKTSAKRNYVVRVTNVRSGTQEDMDLSSAARGKEYSLWPTFTVYIIGFALLGLSFIAHTLRLISLFWILLLASAVLVLSTAVLRSYRNRT